MSRKLDLAKKMQLSDILSFYIGIRRKRNTIIITFWQWDQFFMIRVLKRYHQFSNAAFPICILFSTLKLQIVIIYLPVPTYHVWNHLYLTYKSYLKEKTNYLKRNDQHSLPWPWGHPMTYRYQLLSPDNILREFYRSAVTKLWLLKTMQSCEFLNRSLFLFSPLVTNLG